MLFSRSCEYAIQALLYLAVKADAKTPIHLRAITGDLRIPHHFLSKILQVLSKHEMIVSFRGSNGGFVLGRHPSDITLYDVAVAVDGKAFLDRCIIGYDMCSDEDPCPAHNVWSPVKSMFLSMIQNATIEKLSMDWDGKSDKFGFTLPRALRKAR